jgi:hypothetical protein
VPGEGVEPSRPYRPGDFESPASTNSATQAFYIFNFNKFLAKFKVLIFKNNVKIIVSMPKGGEMDYV